MGLDDLKRAMEQRMRMKQAQASGQMPVQTNPDMLQQSMQSRPRQPGMLESMMGVGRQFREDPLNALKVMANRAISGPEMPVTTGLEPGPFEKFIGEATRRGAGLQQGFLSGTVPEFLAKHNAPGGVQEVAKLGGAVAGTAGQVMAEQFDEGNPAFSQAAFGFHGTPHKFNKFDIKKIGTGEGAQAYGHGLYFAENPGVAKEYAAKLGPGHGASPEDIGARVMDALGGDKKKAIAELDKRVLDLGDSAPKEFVDNIAKAKKAISDGTTKSYLYRVEIPDEKVAGMLDWDKPLSEQSNSWRSVNEKVTDMVDDIGAHDVGADEFYEMLSSEVGGKEAASKLMDSKGIPGIKYLDQGSRQAGKGTRNIVAFDDKIVNILEVNGKKVKK